jgi:hypothetical protein
MAWDNRGTRRYFYRSRRVGKRVVRDYFGAGPLGELAALLVGELRRARNRHARRAARLDDADGPFRLYHDLLDQAAAAHLLAAGFHRHDRGPWRRRRSDA